MKRQKLLYILNIAKRVNNFSYTSMIAAQELGIEFHIAGNWSYVSDEERMADENQYGIKIHQIDFIRTPYHPGNRKAYIQLKELIQREDYDVIHCNTPIGGVLGRIIGKQCKVKKVIYQAHGFHFYKGAPKKNWLLYYPVEKWLAHYTDALITINQEDYELAKTKLKLRKGGNVYYVPGVGIDTSQYNIEAKSRDKKRIELGLEDGDIALISMGDLIERKNYDAAIRAVAEAKNDKLHYFICGRGPEEDTLKSLAESFDVTRQIHFLGFRSDIKELLTASDIFLFTTKQEGLPRSMMEAMASGLPCIASKIRGDTDLLENTEGGYLCDTDDISAYAEKLNILAYDTELREKMGRNNLIAIQKFSTGTVTDEIRNIYDAELGGIITLNEYILSLIDFFPLWAKKRIELNIPLDAFVLISVGELNANKNNCVIISALEQLKRNDIHYVLCGVGELEAELRTQADNAGLHDNVHFLGYRKDVKELYEMTDCFVMPSLREGLSRAIMEAMASGMPCVVSRIRGNKDLIKNGEGGYLCGVEDVAEYAKSIKTLVTDPEIRKQYRSANLHDINKYNVATIIDSVEKIYSEI